MEPIKGSSVNKKKKEKRKEKKNKYVLPNDRDKIDASITLFTNLNFVRVILPKRRIPFNCFFSPLLPALHASPDYLAKTIEVPTSMDLSYLIRRLGFKYGHRMLQTAVQWAGTIIVEHCGFSYSSIYRGNSMDEGNSLEILDCRDCCDKTGSDKRDKNHFSIVFKKFIRK